MTREDFKALEFNVNRSLEDFDFIMDVASGWGWLSDDLRRRFYLLRAHLGALANLVEVEREFMPDGVLK